MPAYRMTINGKQQLRTPSTLPGPARTRAGGSVDGSTMGELSSQRRSDFLLARLSGREDFPPSAHICAVQRNHLLMLAFPTGYKPILAIFLFVLPMPMGLFMTALGDIRTSQRVKADNPYEASFNNQQVVQPLYRKPGISHGPSSQWRLHWSKLPASRTPGR